MSWWRDYGPEMWATGGEPMTDRQLKYLCSIEPKAPAYLEQKAQQGLQVTKAEASTLLTKYEMGEQITQDFLDSLGRRGPVETPSHPLTWAYCHQRMTAHQEDWLNSLALELGVPQAALNQYKPYLTRGQASWLIDLLRAEKGVVTRPSQVKREWWLEDAVAQSVREVPLPGMGALEAEDEDRMDVD